MVSVLCLEVINISNQLIIIMQSWHCSEERRKKHQCSSNLHYVYILYQYLKFYRRLHQSEQKDY